MSKKYLLVSINCYDLISLQLNVVQARNELGFIFKNSFLVLVIQDARTHSLPRNVTPYYYYHFRQPAYYIDLINIFNQLFCQYYHLIFLPIFSTNYFANIFNLTTVHYGKAGVQQCTMGNQVYDSAQWAIRCMTVQYGKSGARQCTMGNQVYASALWAIRCTTVHYGQSGVYQCTMGNEVYTSALWEIRCTPVHYW